jgi:replicative DNA helicase
MSIAQHLDRIPPQNLEAEQGVLGSMLLDRDAIARAVEGLRPEDFYRDAHRVIFTAMIELFERGEPVDLITVTNRLTGMGKIEDIGGATYLASLPNVVPTAANVDYYASIVLEKSMLRALISAGTHIASIGYDAADDVEALIDQAEKLVFGIASRRNTQDFQPIKEILKESFERIDKRYQEKGTVTGIATGFTDLDMLTSGLQPADMAIVAARPSVGKCLSYDSEIVLEDGSIATIEELYRRRDARLLTLCTDRKLRWTRPSAFVHDGIKPVFRVTTRLGRTVECTASHPFLTLQGWLPLAALNVSDRIAVPRKIGVFGNSSLRECEIKLLAYLIGDGALTGGNVTFTNGNQRMVEDFSKAVRELGMVSVRRERDRSGHPSRGKTVPREDGFDRPGVTPRTPPSTMAPRGLFLARRNAKNPVMRMLIRHGLWGKGAGQKTIPPSIFTLPRAQLALFLNRLSATDGWASSNRDGKIARIGYTPVSARLARQVQHLLLRFGVISSLKRRSALYRGSRREAWQLQITDPASIQTFADEIGIFSKEQQLARAVATAGARQRRPNPDGIPAGIRRAIAGTKGTMSWASPARRASFAGASNIHVGQRGSSRGRLPVVANVVNEGELHAPAGSEIYWDEIATIEPIGRKHVYDLTIPETHNFVANDICVHNTTFALNIAQHASLVDKTPVAIFSLETSKEQLVQRILCSEAQVDNSKLRTGFLADEDWRKLARAMGELSEAPIYIDDSATLSVIEMRAKARKLRAEHGLGLIVIDYIQMIQSYKRAENRTQELSEIARSIKSLAKELDVPIIAISQLSRAVEALGQKRPMLSHLRESGELEQVADLVAFLYREDYYDAEKAQKENKENICEVIIAKHRNGPIGTVELYFHKEYSRFANLERRR